MKAPAAGDPTRVSRAMVLKRGLANACPNCGRHSLFPPRSLRVHRDCPVCGLRLDQGEGFFLGPWVLNYGVTVFGFVLPIIVLGVKDVLPSSVSLGLAIAGALGLPLLLYRPSWSWWLALYFSFLPEKLPANGGQILDDDR